MSKDKVSAIIVGDIHYRDDQPRCRLDDFWKTQKRKALWLRELWEDYGRPLVLQPGDVFHRWKSSPQVISAVLEYLPPMVTVPGNHDLPNHSMELYHKSALAVVSKIVVGWAVLHELVHRAFPINDNKAVVVRPLPWGVEPIKYQYDTIHGKVALAHITVIDGDSKFDGWGAMDLLWKLEGYDLVVTGDNHKPIWVTDKQGRHLINPGSFTRQSADENHSPAVYLWWAEYNRLEEVQVPIEEGVITREHLATKEERDERLEAFVESLTAGVEVTVKFRDNVLARLAAETNLRPAVVERIREALGDE